MPEPANVAPPEVRRLCRANEFNEPTTAAYSDGYVQANLMILPEKYAQDFRNLCMRNPVS